MRYDDWYCFVGDDTEKVYSSKTNTYIPADSPAVVAAKGPYCPGKIANEAELWDVLRTEIALPPWLFDGTTFSQTGVGVYNKAQLHAYNADARWRKEQGGTTVNLLSGEMPIKTDDRAQAKITGVFAAQQANPKAMTPWHAADGLIYQLDDASITNMNYTLLTHINGCFAVSANVIAGIEAGAIKSIDQIDAMYAAPLSPELQNWIKPS
jgi:hypothetical protein